MVCEPLLPTLLHYMLMRINYLRAINDLHDFRNLLDDPTFREEVRSIGNEPTPYFGQLAKEEASDVPDTKDKESEEELAKVIMDENKKGTCLFVK